jgi:hypothetical protein
MMQEKEIKAGAKQVSKSAVVKIAGIMFILAFLVPALNWGGVLSKLTVIGDIPATVKNIMANEMQFRIGLTVELFMSVFLIALAAVLYTILKPVSKDLARFALLVKMTEAALAAAIVLISFAALQAAAAGGLHNAVGVVLSNHAALFAVPMVLLGIDMMLFCYLFLKSKYIPAWLAWFGIFSFALIFIHSLAFLLNPEFAAKPVIQGIFYGPSGLFEIVIGIWLLTKGLRIPKPQPAE